MSANFRDGVVTCNAFGLPPPSVEWSVPQSSEATTSHIRQSVFISTTLQFSNGFLLNDVGTYDCIVQNSTVSESITLSQAASPAIITAPAPCQVNSKNVSFQLRVLTTDCSPWDEALKQQIASNFKYVLTGGIISQCQSCVIDVDEIMVTQGPDCSVVKDGATVFQGSIWNNKINDTRDTFCALRNWWMLRPLVRISDDLQLTDVDCVMLVDSKTPRECPIQAGVSLTLIYSTTGGVALFLLLVLFILANIIWIHIIPRR